MLLSSEQGFRMTGNGIVGLIPSCKISPLATGVPALDMTALDCDLLVLSAIAFPVQPTRGIPHTVSTRDL